MSDDTREKSFREATQESQKGLIGEFWAFMSENAKWWLIPFLVVNDPTPDDSVAFALEAVAGGADALELGIAFSDPVADGPVIQAADRRVLDAGGTVASAF